MGKKSRAIFDPVNSGLSLPPPPSEVRARECILWVKNKASSINMHFFHAEITKHSAFLYTEVHIIQLVLIGQSLHYIAQDNIVMQYKILLYLVLQ